MSRNIPVAQTAKGKHWSLGKWNNSVFVLTSNLKIVNFIINLYFSEIISNMHYSHKTFLAEDKEEELEKQQN